ncbi:MAG: hypothetical protein ACFFBD_23100 [Candidatus Hodarchaeota archaeon]
MLKITAVAVAVKCSVCRQMIAVSISDKEIEQAQKGLRFIKKAVTHKDHVVTLHIDGYGQIRREYATTLVENRAFEEWFSTFS